MRISGKYMKDDVLVGFEITDDVTYSVSPMSLYLEPTMQALTETGYTYYDYNPENIKLPNGDSIMSVPTLEYTDEVKVEITLARRGLTHVLSDAQASKYYSTPTMMGAEVFFTQYPGEYLINTREELYKYVDLTEQRMMHNPCAVDVVPFNTLVNPDIWFTPDEIINAEDNLYQRILNLRKWANYEHYMLTCEFFVKQGLMREGDYSVRSMFNAWYAYGPDLIKGKYVSTAINLDVDGDFYGNDRLITFENVTECAANRRFTTGAYNTRTGRLFSSTGENVDADGMLSLDRGSRQALWLSDVQLNKLKANDTDYEVIVVPSVGVAATSDRFHCSIYSDGRTFDFKADNSRVMLSYGNQRRMMDVPMLIGTVARGMYVPLSRIGCKEDYTKILIAQVYSIIYSRRITVQPISRSNTDYLKAIHMNIIAIIRKYCSLKDPSSVRCELNPAWNLFDLLPEALNMYAEPIPAYILEAFELTNVETKEEFLANADIDKYLSKMISASSLDSGVYLPTFIPANTKGDMAKRTILTLQAAGYTHEPYNYYKFIELVHDVIGGMQNYGCLEEGIAIDSTLNLETATNAILAVVNAVKGSDCSIDEFSKTVDNLNLYVDMNKIYRPRKAAAIGYVRDFARDAEQMFSDSTTMWCYVSRVYRELSNKPVNEQRPYLLELIAFSKNNKADLSLRQTFTKIAEIALQGKSIVPDYDYEQQFEFEGNKITTAEKLSQKFAGYLGATLMFRCLVGVKTGKIPTTTQYEEKVSLFDDLPVTLIVPANILQYLQNVDIEAHRRFVPLEFYVTWEMSMAEKNSISQFACVNAEITPWSVTPLKGYSIKSYPLMQNYYDEETLIQSLGAEKTTAIVANKVKITKSLKQSSKDPHAFLNGETETPSIIMQTATCYDDFNCLLAMGQTETIDAYVKRWTLAKKEAKALGKQLLSIPLKQDILYGEIGESLGFSIDTVPVYTDDDSVKANFLAEDILPLTAVQHVAAIEQKKVSLNPLNTKSVDEDIARNFATLAELPILPAVEFYGTVIVNGNPVNIDWIKENFVEIREGKWVGRLQSGFYVLEEE